MHPYRDLPPHAFWKSAVSARNAMELEDVFSPRFPIDRSTRIAAAGSCFAQHIGKQFKQRGYAFVDVEPAPPGLPAQDRARYGYDIYSARYGNIYSARQLRQTFARAAGSFVPDDEYWEEDGRFYDPYRPTIEPRGYESVQELRTHRDAHLRAVRSILGQTDVFVFTFGLTEGWLNARDGAVYPVCPGTARGVFSPDEHRFVNFRFREVLEDFELFMEHSLQVNPSLRFLLTVSPVPLTATASGDHVLAATTESKSILRAVCGELRSAHHNVDYFPSYELVASHPMRAAAYEPNLRAVSAAGVSRVMDVFFGALPDQAPPSTPRGRAPAPSSESADGDVVCDEILLEAFAR